MCMRGDDLIYRHLPFKKLGFFAVQLWPLFFFSSTFSNEQCFNLSLDDPNPDESHCDRTVQNGDQKNSFLLVENTEIIMMQVTDSTDRHRMPRL